MKRGDLIGNELLHANRVMHRSKEGFGGSGWKHTDAILEFIQDLGGVNEVLDYGAGEATLAKSFKKRKCGIIVRSYDPAVPKFAMNARPADLVVCTDVLEHVEPDKIDNVIQHIWQLTKKAAYIVVATREANKKLPDGRNAHLIIEDAYWWLNRFEAVEWRVNRFDDIRKGGTPTGGNHEVRAWLLK